MYIIKKYETLKDNPQIRIYINKINTGYFELLRPQAMKLLGISEKRITKAKNGEKASQLEVIEVVLVHCNLVNNAYHYKSHFLYTFTPNKSFRSLIDISPSTFIFLKHFKSEFLHVNLLFTDQSSVLLEFEDGINFTLVIN